jgi:hypothetical protein
MAQETVTSGDEVLVVFEVNGRERRLALDTRTILLKHAAQIQQVGMTPASFAARFSVRVRILLTHLDGR